MKIDFLKIIFGVIVGIFLALLFRCEPECPMVQSEVKYVPKRIEVPVDSIVYVKGPTNIVYVKQDPITKEIIIYRDRPSDVTVKPTKEYERQFAFSSDTFSIKGTAKIVTDSLYKFDLSLLEVNYTDKVITNTIEAKRRANLLVGSNFIFSPTTEFAKGMNLNVGFKTRKDFVFEVGYNANFDAPDTYEAGVKIPLFHKKNK